MKLWAAKFAGGFSLVVLAALFRVYLLQDIPSGLSTHEIDIISSIGQLTTTPIYPLILKGILLLATYVGIDSPTETLVFLRTASAMMSIASVFLIYASSRKIFGPRVALLSGFLWAIFFPSILAGRTMSPDVLLFFLLSVGFFCIAHLSNKIFYLPLALTLALIPFTVPNGIVFLLSALIGLALMVKLKKVSIRIEPITIISASLMLIAVVAYIVIFVKSRGSLQLYGIFEYRSAFFSQLTTPGPLDPSLNTVGVPIYDILGSSLFVLGLVYLASDYSKHVRPYLLWLLLSAFVASFIKLDSSILSFNFFYFAALILSAVTFDLGLTSWLRLFPYNKVAKSLGVSFAALFLFISMLYSYNRFFVAFGQNPESRASYHEGIVETAELISAKNKQTVVYSNEPAFRGLYFLTLGRQQITAYTTEIENLGDYVVVVDNSRDGSKDLIEKIDSTVPALKKQSIMNRLDTPAFTVYYKD